MYLRKEKLSNLAAWDTCYREIREAEECVSLRTLAVNGSDLIAAGLQPGRELGDILKQLLDEVLETPEKTKKTI